MMIIMMINQKDEETQDDRGRDGGTNFILRIKEQETFLTLQEHYDDDDCYNNVSNDDGLYQISLKSVKKLQKMLIR